MNVFATIKSNFDSRIFFIFFLRLSQANDENAQLFGIKVMLEEQNQALKNENNTLSDKLETQAVKLTEGFNISQKE